MSHPVLRTMASTGFLTLHGEDGAVVNIADPRRPGMATLPLFDQFSSAVGLLMHLSRSRNRHGDVVALARWDGSDLPMVLGRAVATDRSVAAFHDGDGRLLLPPDDERLRAMAEMSSAPLTSQGRVTRRFDLLAVEWVETAVR